MSEFTGRKDRVRAASGTPGAVPKAHPGKGRPADENVTGSGSVSGSIRVARTTVPAEWLRDGSRFLARIIQKDRVKVLFLGKCFLYKPWANLVQTFGKTVWQDATVPGGRLRP